jgi:hypothetical protein
LAKAHLLKFMGILMIGQNQFERAYQSFENAREIFHNLKSYVGQASSLFGLGYILFHQVNERVF